MNNRADSICSADQLEEFTVAVGKHINSIAIEISLPDSPNASPKQKTEKLLCTLFPSSSPFAIDFDNCLPPEDIIPEKVEGKLVINMDKRKRSLKFDEMEHNQLKTAINALRELIKDSAFSKQRKTLEDIQKTVEKAVENERKLNAKCLRLQSEVAANTSKIKAAIQLSEEDKNTIDTLQEELEKAWKTIEDLRLERSKNMQAYSPLSYPFEQRSSQTEILQNNTINKSLQRKISNPDKTEKLWASEKQTLQKNLDLHIKASESLKAEVRQLQQQIKNLNSILSEKDKTIKQLETNVKVIEELNSKELGRGDHDAITTEIENNKLQIFELEEEITNQEKCIEELTNENRIKTARLEEVEREVVMLKKSNKSSVENTEFHLKEKEHKEQGKKCRNKNPKSIERHLSKLTIRENEFSVKLKVLELSLVEKTNLLYSVQNDNSILRSALHEKIQMCKILEEQCNDLKDEISKSRKAMKELENMRNKHVLIIGKLENKNCELAKELAVYDHKKYPEEIKCLENELSSAKESSQRAENVLRVLNREMQDLRTMLVDCTGHLKESLQIISSIQTSNNTITEAGLEFHSGNSMIYKKNQNLRIFVLTLKEKVEKLVEYCKELMMEKYKLFDELECQKNVLNSTTKETKCIGTDEAPFEVGRSCESLQTSYNESKLCLSDTNYNMLDENLSEHSETEQQIEDIGSNEYETYMSLMKEKTFLSHVQIHSSQSHPELDSEATGIHSRGGSSCPTIETHLTKDEKRSQVKLLSNENNRTENTYLERDCINKNANSMRSMLERTVKKNAAASKSVTSQDLMKYSSQLRMKQKRLDFMTMEIAGYSSDFSSTKDVSQRDSLSALQSIVSLHSSSHPILVDITYALANHLKKKDIRFCWIPGHAGITGNELADTASRSVTGSSERFPIPHSDLKACFRQKLRSV
ncbi:uncharacterized protein TNIN_318871 [Trichonephila inaurata madagascariensis]|uniref:RNase H type-1 domain-containing protein n=1 Tax=Trichonephila inaurata madagascariensis TaxID=2747483 RepID=A0A8X6YXA6_9ARAC|nr:uncharacterized protein TNIN_318871 [Trichonephila inaurata madagascariensis]